MKGKKVLNLVEYMKENGWQYLVGAVYRNGVILRHEPRLKNEKGLIFKNEEEIFVNVMSKEMDFKFIYVTYSQNILASLEASPVTDKNHLKRMYELFLGDVKKLEGLL